MKKYVDDFIDFGPGRGYFPSNTHIEYYKPVSKQIHILREDMFSFSYGDEADSYVLDVGWYGTSFSVNGFFRVVLVRDNWLSPLISVECKSVKRLVPAIQMCLARLRQETDNFTQLPPNK